MSTYWDVKRGVVEAINDHDVHQMLEHFSPDAIYVSPVGMAEGRDQIAWVFEQIFKAFPDYHITAWYEMTDCGNPAVSEWTATGTHTGLLLLPGGREFQATGRHITLRGSCFSFLVDEKISTHREYFDQLELYTQLGLCLVDPDPVR
jgi:ketosteroid isomerase-like protein